MRMEKEMNRTERKRAQTGYIAALLGFIAAVFVDQITKYLAVIFLKNKKTVLLYAYGTSFGARGETRTTSKHRA